MQLYYNTLVAVDVGGFRVSRGVGASGYAAEGPFCEIEPKGPSYTTRRGQDGTYTSAASNDLGASVKFHTLSSNSSTNGFFSGLLAADEAGLNGASVVSITIKDLRGTSLFESVQARLLGRPKQPYGPEVVDLEWEFFAEWKVWVIGGNG